MKEVNPEIFKAYDIRGIYPTDLNEQTAFLIGQAFAELTNLKKIVVGYDMRLSSPKLHQSLLEGLLNRGVEIDDLGMVSTDTFYFALNYYQYGGGIMVTASHNPKTYGGFKLFGLNRRQIYADFKMPEFKEMVLRAEILPKKPGGKIKKIENIVYEYSEFCLKFVNCQKIKPFSVVLDAGSGMASKYLERILPALPIKPIKLFFEPDGNFPFHEPNPVKAENLTLVKKEIKTQKADFGFSFDGDADRIILLDENGQPVGGDIMLALVALKILKEKPGSTFVKQIVGSKTIDSVVNKAGGKIVIAKVGTAFIKEAMNISGAVFAGEISGHFYFQETWNFDSGLLMFLKILEVLSETEKKPSFLISEIDKYFRSGEINSEVKDKEAKLEELKKKYASGKINLLDGVTVEYPVWWFNVRPSNTEPLLRLNVEAETEKLMIEKRNELLKIIRN